MRIKKEPGPLVAEAIAGRIVMLRGERVLLDADLAELYGVETKTLNRAVKRHRDRFPHDFMFQLTGEEAGIVFNVKGNDYRLVVAVHYNQGMMFIRFVGTHREYDSIDASKI